MPRTRSGLVPIATGLLAGLSCVAPGRRTDAGGVGPQQGLELIIAATTDVHGRVRGWDYYGNVADPLHSLARAATVVDSLRASAPGRVVLVDAGDFLQGNPFTYVAARVDTVGAHPVIAAMNAMGYDAAAVGNHEFNYGMATLARAVQQARFPVLAANVCRCRVSRSVTDVRPEAFPSYTVVRRGPVTVGIVGATTPGSALWDRDKLDLFDVRDIVPEVRRAVGAVRALSVDVVVVVLHSGLNEPSSYDTVATGVPSENVAARVAREVSGVDLVVYGHSHKEMTDTTIGTTMLMQPRNWAQSVGVAHLTLARHGARWRVMAKHGQLVPTAGHAESPAVLAATQGAHARTLAYVAAPLATTPVAWRADSSRVMDTPLIDLVLDVERRVTGADLASTASFSLDASLAAGSITVAELARLYPYENTLKVIRISGAQLRAYLEQSARYFGAAGTAEPPVNPEVPGYNFDIVEGADYTIDLTRPVGSRITRLAVRGRAVVDADTFTLALNNYRQSGGGGYAMLRGAPVVYDGTTEIRQLLIDDLRRRGTIRPEDVFTDNWQLVPRTAIGPALASMRWVRAPDGRPPRTDRIGAGSRPPGRP